MESGLKKKTNMKTSKMKSLAIFFAVAVGAVAGSDASQTSPPPQEVQPPPQQDAQAQQQPPQQVQQPHPPPPQGSYGYQQFPAFNGPFSGSYMPPPPPPPFDVGGFPYQQQPPQLPFNSSPPLGLYPSFMYPPNPNASINTQNQSNCPARLDPIQMKELTNSILNQIQPKQVRPEYDHYATGAGGYQYASNPYDHKTQAYTSKYYLNNDPNRQRPDCDQRHTNNWYDRTNPDPCSQQNFINTPTEQMQMDRSANPCYNPKNEDYSMQAMPPKNHPCDNNEIKPIDPCAQYNNTSSSPSSSSSSSTPSFFQYLFGGGSSKAKEEPQPQFQQQQQPQFRSLPRRRTYPDYSMGLSGL